MLKQKNACNVCRHFFIYDNRIILKKIIDNIYIMQRVSLFLLMMFMFTTLTSAQENQKSELKEGTQFSIKI